MEVPQKTKNRTAIYSGSSTPGNILEKRNENTNKKDICILMFLEALFTAVNIWKQSKCPSVYRWIKKCGLYI